MRTLKKLIFKTFRCVSGLLLELHFLTLSSFQRTTYCCNQSCVFLRRLDLSKLNKVKTNVWVSVKFLRKEVIQPHLPIRLPCYDFTPVIRPAFGSSLLSVGSLTSGVTDSHGVTGGVYKTRERIHRGILIRDY